MYQDLKKNYRWPGMKKSIVEYVVECVVSQQVNISIKGNVDCYNHWKFYSGNGIVLPWTLL